VQPHAQASDVSMWLNLAPWRGTFRVFVAPRKGTAFTPDMLHGVEMYNNNQGRLKNHEVTQGKCMRHGE
jgi:hypothetical protein